MSWKRNVVGNKNQEKRAGSFKKYPASRLKSNYDYAEKREGLTSREN